jgi:hypothetical protein
MSIQSASATFVRFYVPDTVTEDFWGYIEEKLQSGSFKECEDDQEQSVGFVSWDDLFDPSFADISYHKGEYLAFQFRVDQRSVPAIIRKKYVRRSIDDYRAKNNGKWPSRRERQEIQENVQDWLMKRIIPRPGGCEVVWNPAAKWMLLGGTSSKWVDAFLTHFEKHFRFYPIPLYHVHWAMNLAPLDGRQKDVLASIVSAQSPHAMYEGRPLGYEFLTWLWFLMEDANGAIELSEGRHVELSLGERLVLTLPADGKERVICTTQANSLHEARTALQQGKLVDEIQLFLKIADNDYFLTLDSFLWAFKGLKTPKQLPDFDGEDAEGKFLERMFFLEEISEVLNKLYGMFLAARLSPVWEKDVLPRIRKWMAQRPQEGTEHIAGGGDG